MLFFPRRFPFPDIRLASRSMSVVGADAAEFLLCTLTITFVIVLI